MIQLGTYTSTRRSCERSERHDHAREFEAVEIAVGHITADRLALDFPALPVDLRGRMAAGTPERIATSRPPAPIQSFFSASHL